MKEMLFVSLTFLSRGQSFLRSLNLLEEGTKGSIKVNGYDLTDKFTTQNHSVKILSEWCSSTSILSHIWPYWKISLFLPCEHKLMTKAEAEKLGMELLGKCRACWQGQCANPGGQRQRGATARGLAMNPDIISDEPTSPQSEMDGDVLDVMKDGWTRQYHDHRNPRNGICPRLLPIELSLQQTVNSRRWYPWIKSLTIPQHPRLKEFLTRFLSKKR